MRLQFYSLPLPERRNDPLLFFATGRWIDRPVVDRYSLGL
jgi:hypothetical protein